jgi:cell division protein FtsB
MNLPILLKRIVFYSAMIFGIYNLTSLSLDIYGLSQKEAEKNQKIQNLEAEKSKLNERLSYINSEDFVEKEARTKLNMKKEGEQVFVVNNGSDSFNSSSENEKKQEKKSNFSKWMEVIF